MTNVRNQVFSRPVLLEQSYDNEWFAARNIREVDVLANLAKISRTGIKFGLQYMQVL